MTDGQGRSGTGSASGRHVSSLGPGDGMPSGFLEGVEYEDRDGRGQPGVPRSKEVRDGRG